MPNLQKTGSMAAFTLALVSFLTFLVAIFIIGPETMSNQRSLVEFALRNPLPLIIQDLFKFAVVIAQTILILVMYGGLAVYANRRMKAATFFGVLSLAILLINASISLMLLTVGDGYPAVVQNMAQINQSLGFLGLAAIFFNGIWYLLVSYTALQNQVFPRVLNYLGITLGIISLIPVLGLISLLLNIIWSFWLGIILRKQIHFQIT